MRVNRKLLTPQQQLEIELQGWQANPSSYCREVLGIEQTWALQDQLLEALPRAIQERKSIYVASGHALGKDYICSAVGLWFLQTYLPSNVILTGPTDRQVKGIMWKETQQHWQNKRIALGGKAFMEPRIQMEDDWFLIGFTTKETGATKEGGGGKFQGFHSPNMCIIVTEAQAVEDVIYDQIDALSTPENVLVIYIGNPTRARGRFAAGLKDHVHHIVFNFSCLENPNYLQRKTVIPGLASYEWVEQMRQKWGEDDPRWIGRVLGQVPVGALNTVFPDDLLSHAMSRHGFLATHSDNRGVAVDPAGEGVDDNVFYSGSGGEVLDRYTKTLMSPTEIAHQAVAMCKAINGSWIVVDCDGIGIGAYQQLCGLSEKFLDGIQVIKFHGSAKSEIADNDKRLYENMRAEAAFITRDRMKAGIAAVNDRDVELLEDLREDLHMENKRTGLIQIIPKEEIKEVLGRSPGFGDAYKMLQWGFEQKFSVNVYKEDRATLPRYATVDDTFMDSRQFAGLPAHAVTD